MPRIPDYVMDASIYLYPSRKDALESEPSGGTGVLVGVPYSRIANLQIQHVYAVTAGHVVRPGQATFIRMGARNQGPIVLDRTQDDWVHHPDGDDVAACAIGFPFPKALPPLTYSVPVENIVNDEVIEALNLGLGYDVFMVGRLKGFDGGELQFPSLRFGN